MKRQSTLQRYDMQQVQEILGWSGRTLDKKIEEGRLLGVYKDGKKRFLNADDLEAHLRRAKAKSYAPQ